MERIGDYWQEHKSRLHRYVLSRVRDRDVADDIVQDVFLKAHSSLHTVKAPGSVAAWLHRIAANAIADHYRSQRPWVELPEELPAPETGRDYRGELADCLRPLIAGLPEPYRSALVMSELEGLPQRQVAEECGISLSGAKSRVQRGREKLRERLLECCEIETGRGGIIGYEPNEGSCRGDCS